MYINIFDKSTKVHEDSRSTQIVKAASAICIVIALAALIGWTFEMHILTSITSGWPRMVPLSALGLIAMAAAIVLQTGGGSVRFWLSVALALFSLTLGSSAGITRYIGQAPLPFVIAPPGNEPLFSIPSTLTCIGLITTSVGFLMIAGRRSAGVGQSIALFTLFFGLLTGLGFVAQDTFLYQFLPGQGTSLPTVISFTVLAIGLLFLRTELGIMVAVSSNTPHARTSRRLLLSSIAIPVLLGVGVALGIQLGWYNVETGILLLVWGLIVLLGILIWRYAFELHHVDARRNRAERDLRFLANASAELSDLVEPKSTLNRLACLAVPEFADWCTIDLLQQDGTLQRMAVVHTDPEKIQMSQDMQHRFPPDPEQPRGSWAVIKTGQPILITRLTEKMLDQAVLNPDYKSALKRLGIRSYMGVPLTTHGKMLGVVGFVSAESGRLYTEEDLALAEDLARRMAVAIENANLYRMVQESDHAKDVFLATLAHELRNPLAAISGGINLLKLADCDSESSKQYVRLIARQTDHLSRLVDDLADMSRISTGKIQLRKEPVPLAEVLHSAVETSRAEIEAGRHALTVTIPEENTEIVADPVRLTQVFSNLLTNAARYTNPGGKIDLILECLQEEFAVHVKDNGIGIDPDMLKDIFKMFSQITHPVQRPRSGLGIGLSLVEGLVQLHEGRVEALSPGPGKGSEFIVHLPRNAPAEISPDQDLSLISPNAAGKHAPQRILVVDDNVDAATSLADVLKIMGHTVSKVHDGQTALAAVEVMNLDVVLLDIGLPDMDGYEVARRIRSIEGKHRIRLIAVTGWGQEQDKQRAFDAGFNQHWVKPVRLEQIEQMLAVE